MFSMRKRFVLLLRVFVENYASGLINEGIADTVAWSLSASQVAFYMEYARVTLQPLNINI